MKKSRPRPCTSRLALALAGMLVTTGALAKTPAPQLGKAPIADVIAAMTLEEKIALVNGEGMFIPGMDELDLGEERRAPVVGQSNKKVPGAAGTTFPIPRLGIPSIALADGPAGLRIAPTREGQERTFYATAFPIETSLASTWNVDLVQNVGAAMGHEVKEYGVDVLLAPGQNIHRYPLGGRNFEYYSEDPLLSGKMSAAMVRGVQAQGVGVSIKHFVANNHEWNRHTIDVKIDERALREIYLRGFEIAVKEANPWTIMSSYNKLNGTYTSEFSWLLTDVLRNQWKYNGMVVTDWFGGRDPVAQMQAGNELLMPGTQSDQDTLLAAVRGGALDERVLDRNIERILELILRGPTFQQYAHSDQPDLKANAAIARTAAAEGMVLLKNERTALPLQPKAKLALFGNSGYEPVSGGTGSGDVNKAYMISFSQGLDEAGFAIDAAVAKANGAHIEAARAAAPPPVMFMPRIMLPEYAPSPAVIDAAAKANDVAIVTIGRDSGEMLDRTDADFNISDTERQMLSAISRAFRAQGKPVVVLLNIGGVIETASWRDLADAIVIAWQPGQEAGHAVADVLSGKVNPSGKLPDTFALQLPDYPAAADFPGKVLLGPDPDEVPHFGQVTDREAENEYRDGIWVGYRHFDTRNVEVAYPFGYGLSYTNFSYSGLKLETETVDDALTATVTITNTGKVAGKEAVQVYIAAPQETLEKPAAELRAFSKTGLLQPGQSQTLTFQLNARDLASFDPAAKAWVAAPGQYEIRIGASSRDIRQRAGFNKPKATRLPL